MNNLFTFIMNNLLIVTFSLLFLVLTSCEKDNDKLLNSTNIINLRDNSNINQDNEITEMDLYYKALDIVDAYDSSAILNKNDFSFSNAYGHIQKQLLLKYNLDLFVNGITYMNEESNNWYISIDNSLLENGCNVEIHKTLIHEFLHADLKEIYKRAGPYFHDHPKLKKYFDDGDGEWEHDYMAGELIDKIVEGLKKIYGDKYTEREYKAIAWNGLHNTEAFKNSGFTVEELNEISNDLKENCEKSCID